MPKFAFNPYGAADSLIAKDRPLLVDTAAADDRGEPRHLSRQGEGDADHRRATTKPKEAVEFAIDMITKNCILSVNEGFVRDGTEWTHQNSIDIGDL